MIFVAHSLGGLVCAHALSQHHGPDQAGAELSDKTIGIIFLGTPFEGSSKAAWGSRALRILDYISTTQKESVKDLEKRSEKLININMAFQKYRDTRSRSEERNWIEVACFFEEYPMFKNIWIVPKESAMLPGVDALSIAANHTDMCKFEHSYVNGFKLVSEKLNQWIQDIGKQKTGSAGRNTVRFGNKCWPFR